MHWDHEPALGRSAEFIPRVGPQPTNSRNEFRAPVRGSWGDHPELFARLAPLNLKTSAEMRLQRLARGAIFKDDSHQLVIPIKHGAEPAEFLVAFLRELIPA